MGKSRDIEIVAVQDGWIIGNLSKGFCCIPTAWREGIDRWSKQGRFYPYELIPYKPYVGRDDIYRYRVIDWTGTHTVYAKDYGPEDKGKKS